MDPTGVPFKYHWYVGVAPRLVPLAVNVTFVPAQMVVLGLAEIVAVGVTFAVTVMVIVLLVAEAGTGQTKLEFMSTLTVFPFAKVEVVYVSLLVPTLAPFTCH